MYQNWIQHIPELVEDLKHKNFKVTSYDYTLLQKTLIELSKINQLPASKVDIQNLLTTILCKSVEEKRVLENSFDNWFERYDKYENNTPIIIENPEFNILYKFKLQITASGIILGLSSILYLLLGNLAFDIKIPNPIDSYIEFDFSIIIILMVVILLFYLIWIVIWKIRLNLFLKRKLSTIRKNIQTFFFNPLSIPLNTPLINSAIAKKLRKREAINSIQLDVEKTIENTIKATGLFSPITQSIKVAPQYLLLINKKGYSDIQARLIDEFSQILNNYDIDFIKYYFYEDPRSVYNEKTESSLNLVELGDKYGYKNLIVFSSLDYLVSPEKHIDNEWINQFDSWANKIIFYPPNQNYLNHQFDTIKTNNFNFYTFNTQGFSDYIYQINTEKILNESDNYLPVALLHIPQSWLTDKIPSKEDKVYILDNIVDYLSPNELYWFTACSAYPEVNWNLTIFFGKNLYNNQDEELYSQESLTKLAQLPWLRNGKIPDWLRLELLALLNTIQKNKIKQALNSLFEQAATEPISDFKLSYQPSTLNITKALNRLFNRIDSSIEKDTVTERLFSILPNKLTSILPRPKLNAVQKTFEENEKEAFLGHPKKMYVLFFTELFERFAFYGMRVLFILYLLASFEFEKSYIYALFSTYAMSLYLSPIVGGYVADRYFGAKKAVLYGSYILSVSFILLAIATITTPFIFYLGLILSTIGTGFYKPNITSLLASSYDKLQYKKDSAYNLFYLAVNGGAFLGMLLCGFLGENISWFLGFGLAAFLMLMASIFFKVSSYVFENPKEEAPINTNQDIEYSLKFTTSDKLLIFICSIIGSIYIVDEIVVAIDLGIPIVLIGLALFFGLIVSRLRRYQKVVRDRLIVLTIFAVCTVIFWMFFEQGATSLVVFTEDNTDRLLAGNNALVFKYIDAFLTFIPLLIISYIAFFSLKNHFSNYYKLIAVPFITMIVLWGLAFFKIYQGFSQLTSEIPTSWFSTLNSLFIIMLTPFFVKWWESRYNPSPAIKYSLGLILLALGYGVLSYGSYGVTGTMKVSITWLVLAYFFHTIGELFLSPLGLSYVSKLVPAKTLGFMFGVWYLVIAIGNKLSGYVASYIEDTTIAFDLSTSFWRITIFSFSAGIIILLLNPVINRMMHGVK